MSTYLIAEIGQNHNGSVEIARQLIDMAAMKIHDAFFDRRLPGVDAVKFVKRDLEYETTESQRSQPYPGVHSFGRTYGEHRAFLELSERQHHELYQHAQSRGLGFIETLCAPSCLKMLDLFEPDALKVASRDLTNEPLLVALAETRLPLILSAGMTDGDDVIARALELVTAHHEQITLLHCVSQYPAEYHRLNLRRIVELKTRFAPFPIGYSDHSIGIMAPVAAVALGAEVIEKHVTLDRSMRGGDHHGSLAPDGLFRMVRDIRNLERALAAPAADHAQAVEPARNKLERSLAARADLPRGHVIAESDLCLLSPGTGLRWSQRGALIGRRLAVAVPRHELILLEHLQS